MSNQQLWSPSPERIAASHAAAFMAQLASGGVAVNDFRALYDWSIADPARFWKELWQYAGVIHSTPPAAVLEHAERMPGARWFRGAELNYAENLLRHTGSEPALIFRGESQLRRELTRDGLRAEVAAVAVYLREVGIQKGDRIAGFVPNLPEAIVAMLAAASIGAIWSSCSPDFGVSGVVDRFGQIEPRVLFSADGYYHKGRAVDSLAKAGEVLTQIPSIERLIVIPYAGGDRSKVPNAVDYRAIADSPGHAPRFEQLPFDHPLYIMYSSGTTGKPKCIVHGAGGVLLEHLKELLLHTDLHWHDRILYQTTCGWMMWNWLVSSLAAGAGVVLYDGAPFHENGAILFRTAQEERVSIFGTNAKFLSALEKESIRPGAAFDLSALHTVLSTGSVLLPENFDYVYREIKKDLCLSSISGGTDILGCFALGSPMLPVLRGELQTRSLALKVEVVNETGDNVVGEKGDLVCSAPFPSMPVGFWNDPNQAKYRAAYFEKFPGRWTHGDFVELRPGGGMIFYGRSDAVLNPGGIRIGTAELYRQVERFPEISESLAVGYTRDGDEQIVLFLRMQAGNTLSDELRMRLAASIRTELSPFHVPKHVFEVADIPRTKSGKIVELAVRDILHGREIQNRDALANPEALDAYTRIAQTLSDSAR